MCRYVYKCVYIYTHIIHIHNLDQKREIILIYHCNIVPTKLLNWLKPGRAGWTSDPWLRCSKQFAVSNTAQTFSQQGLATTEEVQRQQKAIFVLCFPLKTIAIKLIQSNVLIITGKYYFCSLVLQRLLSQNMQCTIMTWFSTDWKTIAYHWQWVLANHWENLSIKKKSHFIFSYSF